MSASPTAAVYLNAMGVSCALGAGAAEMRAALFDAAQPGGVALSDRWTPGRPQWLGALRHEPAPLGCDVPVPLRSRNNALLAQTLTQLRSAVDAAVAHHGPGRVAVVLGTSTAGVAEGEAAARRRAACAGWPPGYHYGQQEMGSPAAFVAHELGVHGPSYGLSTACSSAAKALASGARLLHAGLADAVVAGGADTLCGLTLAGFGALESVSAARTNPLSANRRGINIGEGAALFLMTREPGPVRLAGWGETSDAHHMSAPEPAGRGAIDAMRQALKRAGIAPAAVDYVNLHGTATVQNDAMESRAVAEVLGHDVPVSSTKPLTGHALAAAAAIETAIAWLTLVDNPGGALPPHWWDGASDPALAPLRIAGPGASLGRAPRLVLSNSFAFGGSNAVLVLAQGD
jgi:3-oxoacyl-[acyl-carrier-protein] synthase-1